MGTENVKKHTEPKMATFFWVKFEDYDEAMKLTAKSFSQLNSTSLVQIESVMRVEEEVE